MFKWIKKLFPKGAYSLKELGFPTHAELKQRENWKRAEKLLTVATALKGGTWKSFGMNDIGQCDGGYFEGQDEQMFEQAASLIAAVDKFVEEEK